MIHQVEKTCPRCAAGLKPWNDLSDEQKMLAERLPASARFTKKERKKHRYCIRCWYEQNAEDHPAESV